MWISPERCSASPRNLVRLRPESALPSIEPALLSYRRRSLAAPGWLTKYDVDQPGTLFGFTPESRSPSPGIRTSLHRARVPIVPKAISCGSRLVDEIRCGSARNAVRLHPGISFAFARNPHFPPSSPRSYRTEGDLLRLPAG